MQDHGTRGSGAILPGPIYMVDVELEQIVMRDDGRPGSDSREKSYWRAPQHPGLDRAVIDRKAQDRDPGVGVLGIGVRAGLAQIDGRSGLKIKDEAHRRFTDTMCTVVSICLESSECFSDDHNFSRQRTDSAASEPTTVTPMSRCMTARSGVALSLTYSSPT